MAHTDCEHATTFEDGTGFYAKYQIIHQRVYQGLLPSVLKIVGKFSDYEYQLLNKYPTGENVHPLAHQGKTRQDPIF